MITEAYKCNFTIIRNHNPYSDAKREMADIISNDWASVKSYSHMIKLWSDRGDVEEVKRLLDEMKTDVGEIDARSRGSMLVTALIKR